MKNLGNLIKNIANKAAKYAKKKKPSTKKASSSNYKNKGSAPNFYGTNISKSERNRLHKLQQEQLRRQVTERRRQEQKAKEKRAQEQAKRAAYNYKYGKKAFASLQGTSKNEFTNKVRAQYNSAKKVALAKKKEFKKSISLSDPGEGYTMDYTFMSDAERASTNDLRQARKNMLSGARSDLTYRERVNRMKMKAYKAGNIKAVSNPRMKQLDNAAHTAISTGNYKLANFATKMQSVEEAYNQVVKGMLPSKEFEDKSVRVQDIINNSGYRKFGISDSEFNRWIKENTIKVRDMHGKPSTQFREDGEWTPLYGYDGLGNKINLAYDFNYALSVGKALETQEKNYNDYLMSMTADHNNTKKGTVNSLSDALRMWWNEDYTGLDALKGFGGHVFNHYMKPIMNGKWSILGSNLLTDMGETFDLPGLALKAVIKNKPYVYGRSKAAVPGQKAWISSIGEDKQLALIEAGVFDATNIDRFGFVTSSGTFKYFTDKELKAIGVTRKEFEKFKKEYEQAILWSVDKIGDDIKAVKEAYTSNQNYDIDTGNIFLDFMVEMMVDPTVLVGGAARSGIKHTAKEIATDSVESGLKQVMGESFESYIKEGKGSQFVKYGEHAHTPLVKDFSKRLQSAMFTSIERKGKKVRLMKPASKIQNEVYTVTKRMMNNGLITEETADEFVNIVYKTIMSERSKSSFNIVKSLHYLNEAEDAFESGLLKGVFIVPYASVKLPKTLIKAFKDSPGMQMYSKKHAILRKQAVREIDAHLTGSVLDIDAYNKALNNTFYDDLDKAFSRQMKMKKANAVEVTYNNFYDNVNAILKSGVKDNATDWEGYLKKIDDEVAHATNGEATTLSEFKSKLKKQSFKNFKSYDKQINNYLDFIEDTEKVLDAKSLLYSTVREAELLRDVYVKVNDIATWLIPGIDFSSLRESVKNIIEFRNNPIRRSSEFNDVVDDLFINKYAKAKTVEDYESLRDAIRKKLVKWNKKVEGIQNKYKKEAPKYLKADAYSTAANYNRTFDGMLFDDVDEMDKATLETFIDKVDVKDAEISSDSSVNIEDTDSLAYELFDKRNRVFQSGQLMDLEYIAENIVDIIEPISTYVDEFSRSTAGDLSGVESALDFINLGERFKDALPDVEKYSLKVATASEVIITTGNLLRDLRINQLKGFPKVSSDVFDTLRFIKRTVEAEYESLLITAGNEVEYIRFQKDKLAVASEGLEDKTMRKAINLCNDTRNPIGKFLRNYNVLLDSYKVYNSKKVKELAALIDDEKLAKLYDLAGATDTPKSFFKSLKGTPEANVIREIMNETGSVSPLELMSFVKVFKSNKLEKVIDASGKLKEQLNKAEAFVMLRDKLTPKNENSPLDEVTNNLVLESLFHFTSREPDNLIHLGSTVMDRFIDKVKLLGDTLCGGDSVALNDFKLQMQDLQHPMYAPYKEELASNPELINRLNELANASLFEPESYTSLMALQSVLKDPKCIKEFNEEAALRDVLFTHLEATGLNARADGITSITFRKWKRINDKPTLNELLDMITGQEVQRFQVELTREEIQQIPNNLLNSYFKLGNRNEKLREYAARFQVKEAADKKNKELKNEKKILEEAMNYLDNSFDTHSSNYPLLVFHNVNRFDENFLTSRPPMKHLKVSTSSIPHLQQVLDNSWNMLDRLKNVTGSIVLIADQEEYIRNAVAEYAYDVRKYSGNMRPFESGKFSKSLKQFEYSLVTLDEELRTAIDGLQDLYVEGNVTPLLDDTVKEVDHVVEYIQLDNKKIRANILLNPDKIDVQKVDKAYLNEILNDSEKEVLSKALAENNALLIDHLNKELRKILQSKTFKNLKSEDEQSLMQLIHSVKGDEGLFALGWKKYINQGEIENYFDLQNNTLYTKSFLRKAQVFAQAVNMKLEKFYKQNRHITGKQVEFTNVVCYFKSLIAEKLYPEDELYFLKDVKIPQTEKEAYIVAQEMWNRITGGIKFEEVYQYVTDKTPYALIPKEYREAAGTILRLNLTLEQLDQVCPTEIRRILDDYKGNYHRDIFLNAPGGTDFLDLEDVIQDDLELTAYLEKIQSEVDNVTGLQYLTKGVDEADYKANAGRVLMHNVVKAIEKYRDLTRTAKYTFLNEQKTLRKWQRDVYSNQILDYCIADNSLKNLVSHLLFHKGIVLFALEGNINYMHKIDTLKELIKKNNKYVYATESQGQLWVGIKKEWVNKIRVENDSIIKPKPKPDSKVKKTFKKKDKNDEVHRMYFDGETKIAYEAPQYTAIPIHKDADTPAFSISGMDEVIDESNQSIARLSNGDSVGSLNQLYSMRMHQNLYKSAPPDFIKNTLPVEYTLNPRFWHRASFDFNRIGSERYFFKLNEVNDKDLLLQQYEVVREMTNRTTAERLFIEEYFGKEAMDTLRAPFLAGMTDDEIAEAITNNDSLTVVVLKSSKGASKSGYWVEEVAVPDGKALRMAEAEGAVLVNYDAFIYLDSLINKQEFSDTFLKVWSYAMRLFKAGQLCNIGTWTRNYIDATFKSAIESGSITETLQWQLRAVQLYRAYRNMSKYIKHARISKFESDIDLERNWDKYLAEYSKAIEKSKESKSFITRHKYPDLVLSYEDYTFLDGFYGNSVGGGMSRMEQIKIDKNTAKARGREFLRNGEAGDLVAEAMDLFKTLTSEQVKKLWRSTEKLEPHGFTEKTFIKQWSSFRRKGDKAFKDVTVKAKFNAVVDQLLESGALNIKGTKDLFKDTFDSAISGMFLPQSVPEEIIRTGLLLQCKSRGYTYDMCLKKIVNTQFGGPQDVKDVYISQVVPFFNFTKDNLLYWVREVIDNPHLLRVVLNAWNELSWEEGQPTALEYARGKVWNDSLLSGKIKLWDCDDASLSLKLNPSFLDAIGWFYNTPSNSIKSLNVPMKYMMSDMLYDKGAITWGMFDNEIFRQFQSDMPKEVKWGSNLPLLGPIISNYYQQSEIMEHLSMDHSIIDMMLHVPTFTTLFGVSAWENPSNVLSDSFNGYLAKLEAQGKWWDPKIGKVVPLSHKYQDKIAWDKVLEQQASKGKYWDANLGCFVTLNNYTFGGLNRKFDFKKPGEWQEFCRLKKYYHDVIWDANQRMFVKEKDFIPGGLNNKNLSWDEVCALTEKKWGEVWDANQGSFVNKDEAISGGLNRKDLSWRDVTTLKLALHGEKWDYKAKRWVKVREPIVKVDLFNHNYMKWGEDIVGKNGMFINMFDSVKANSKYILTETALLKAGRIPESGLVLRGVKAHDDAIFDLLLGGDNGDRGVYNYTSGYAKGYYFNKTPLYGNAFNFNGNAGLRMATTNKTAYDEYYEYNYRYNYNFRVNPYFTSPAGYPDTSTRKDRGNPYRLPLSQYRVILGAKRT